MHKLPFTLAAALIVASLVSFASHANASDLVVSSAFARASAFAAAKSGVVYFTVMNHGATPDRLVAIRTPAAAHASLHKTVQENGVARMEPLPGLDVAPGGMAELTPNGMHVMLTGLKAPLKKGESIKLTLVFEKAGEMEVDVPVGDVAAGHMDH